MTKQAKHFIFRKILFTIIVILCVPVILIIFLKSPFDEILSLINFGFINNIEAFLNLLNEHFFFQLFIYFILVFIFLRNYRKINDQALFNKGDIYLEIPYFIFRIATYLGYKIITLVRLPIGLQYKIVISDLFEKTETENHIEKNNIIKIKVYNKESELRDEVNLLLSDTYKVKENQIPLDKRNLRMIHIDSGVDKEGTRIYNSDFVAEIETQVHSLSKECKRINVFSHTNTHHNKSIIQGAFKKGGRDVLEELYV